jgi:hypothetical protein
MKEKGKILQKEFQLINVEEMRTTGNHLLDTRVIIAIDKIHK